MGTVTPARIRSNASERQRRLGYGVARFVRRARRLQSTYTTTTRAPELWADSTCVPSSTRAARRFNRRERRADFAFHAFCRGITWTCDQQLGTYAPVRMRTRAPNQTPFQVLMKVRPASQTGRSSAGTPCKPLWWRRHATLRQSQHWCRMLSASRAVSSSPLETGCLRCAWSCPLSSERFEVEPQGPEAEVAGLGVAVALRKLLSNWTDPVRRLSNLNPRRILRIGTHVVPLFGRAGFLPCSTRGLRSSQEWVRPSLRSLSSRCRAVPSSHLHRASFTSLSRCSFLVCACPCPRL